MDDSGHILSVEEVASASGTEQEGNIEKSDK